jgi:hypothetical protein
VSAISLDYANADDPEESIKAHDNACTKMNFISSPKDKIFSVSLEGNHRALTY